MQPWRVAENDDGDDAGEIVVRTVALDVAASRHESRHDWSWVCLQRRLGPGDVLRPGTATGQLHGRQRVSGYLPVRRTVPPLQRYYCYTHHSL